MITVDFYPTLVEVAKAEKPENTLLDGLSLVPTLVDGKMEERALYWHFPAYLNARKGKDGRLDFRTTPVSVIRKGDFKLIYYYETRHWELYDLAADIGESENLAKINTEKVTELGTLLVTWLKDTGADLPREKVTGEVVALPDPLVDK